jgi:hypothetical protein
MKNIQYTFVLAIITLLFLAVQLHAIDPYDTTDDTTGAVITVQGENTSNPDYYESRYQAFDNNDQTKWLDFAEEFPDTRSSWIQFQYANNLKYKVTKYTITSANDAPERDPAEWNLLGKNDTSSTAEWTILDMLYDMEFPTRFEKQEFDVAVPGLYNIYRLEIVTVLNLPTDANSVQIAEIEFIGLREDELATGVETSSESLIPEQFSLEKNYPNPFNPITRIAYSIAQSCPVNISVYNILGRQVTTLVNQYHTPGTYTTVWNSLDAVGNTVPSGVYFYRMQAGNFNRSHKMLMVK